MRFVTSGVGGVIVGAGFVARGGVDGRSMMSNRSGDKYRKNNAETETGGFDYEIAMQVESGNLGRKDQMQTSKEEFDSGSSMTAMGGGGAVCRDLDLNYVTNLREKT